MTVRGKKANIAFKYRILPDSRQKELFSKTFGCCRKIWNLMKADRDKAYQENRKTIYPTPAQYKTEYPFLKEVDSLALANVQLNQNKAYREFFKSCKEKKETAWLSKIQVYQEVKTFLHYEQSEWYDFSW